MSPYPPAFYEPPGFNPTTREPKARWLSTIVPRRCAIKEGKEAAGIEPTRPATKHPCSSSILRYRCDDIIAAKPTTSYYPSCKAGRKGPSLLSRAIPGPHTSRGGGTYISNSPTTCNLSSAHAVSETATQLVQRRRCTLKRQSFLVIQRQTAESEAAGTLHPHLQRILVSRGRCAFVWCLWRHLPRPPCPSTAKSRKTTVTRGLRA